MTNVPQTYKNELLSLINSLKKTNLQMKSQRWKVINMLTKCLEPDILIMIRLFLDLQLFFVSVQIKGDEIFYSTTIILFSLKLIDGDWF